MKIPYKLNKHQVNPLKERWMDEWVDGRKNCHFLISMGSTSHHGIRLKKRFFKRETRGNLKNFPVSFTLNKYSGLETTSSKKNASLIFITASLFSLYVQSKIPLSQNVGKTQIFPKSV